MCHGWGTRRTESSPCASQGAHGELNLRRVLLFRRVFRFLRTAYWLFAVCPRNSTRQNFRHTANSRFPVVNFSRKQEEFSKAENVDGYTYVCRDILESLGVSVDSLSLEFGRSCLSEDLKEKIK